MLNEIHNNNVAINKLEERSYQANLESAKVIGIINTI